ncbi:alkaline phosphatase D family protein [Pelomonas aquatica]|jgi:alkaline phosphatase D|uniref:Phosphodiesterase n=1 Tax=Pelomonas aquatica TaxID=431058 RepID=A0A9X4R6V5_9BURK|nr:alkaline phosphatase D family protein [Pelomonas aquatica]MCY4755129.1 alkaline phosphatase D family protein [Pelomonas aquatica]MDG0865211.1 phosphodiesterase [Pelomonas aquatica]
MDRRNFLRRSAAQAGALITASTALSSLVGCGGGGDAGAPIQPLPATFPGTSTPLPTTAAASGSFKFPQSVASGDPKPDGAVLWARVVPASADDVATATGAGSYSVTLKISSADNSANLGTTTALSGSIDASADVPVYEFYDHSLRHRISGLKPATVYYYQFTAGSSSSRVGSFKTAPASDADIGSLNFAYITCQDWSVNHWAGLDALAQENIDFIVHLGDYIYEAVGASYQTGGVESAHAALALPDGTALPTGGKYATTLADYRYLYKRYRTDRRLQNLHERFAFIAIWDDHEFSDDCWQDREVYDNGSFNAATGVGDNTAQTSRRLAATQAWFENMPAEVSFTLDPGQGITNIRLYRDFRFGKLMHLVITDQRLYRADHMIPEAAPNPLTGQPIGAIGARYLVPQTSFNAVEAAKLAAGAKLPDPLAVVSMLGAAQRQWWVQTMTTSTAQWKVWGNEVSLLRMSVDGAKIPAAPAAFKTNFLLDCDQWDGYNAERKYLMGQLLAKGVQNVVAVTGDIHAFYAGVVMADYDAATQVPAMVDLVTAGVSSNSNFSYFYGAASQPAFAALKPLVATSEAEAEGIAIQMLSAAIAMGAGVTDLSNTAAITAAVQAAIAAHVITAAAVTPTPTLSKAVINTFDETQAGTMGSIVANTIAGLAAASRSVAAMTLYGLIQQKLAAALGIPAAAVPASEVIKRLNPFANSTTAAAPTVNNPWIRYVNSDAQGYAVVSLSKTELVCNFKKVARQVGGVAPTTPVASVKTARVAAGVTDVTVS